MPTIVQQGGGYNGTVGTTWSGAYASNLASGNLLIACVGAGTNNITVSGSDTQSNTWTVDASVSPTPLGQSAFVLHTIAASGADTVTIAINGGGNQPISVRLFEVNGLGTALAIATGSGLCSSACGTSGNTNNVSFTSGEFLVSAISIYNPNNGTFSAGANFDSVNMSGPSNALNFAEFVGSGIASPTGFPFSIGATIGNYAEASAAFNVAVVSAFFSESGPKRQYRRGERAR